MTEPLDDFAALLRGRDLPAWLGAGLIGEGAPIHGPFGVRPLIYADYVASGRGLRQIEDFILERVLPYYANSHTEASFCGAFATRLRSAARAVIARLVGVGPGSGCSVVFAGAGATAGLNRLVRLLAIEARLRAGGRVVVLVGPYEHHSNILPWRDSGAEIVELPEAPDGGPDPQALEEALAAHRDVELTVGAFSAASNVTGIITDVAAITRRLKRHGALAVWDYAGAAPYLPMTMRPAADAAIDAIVFSPHKFAGGPGASGVMVVRDALVATARPTAPGGGSVSFVSPWAHDYFADITAREEAGTPDVVGDIRAALVMIVKDALGQDVIEARNRALRTMAIAAWRHHPRIELLGNADAAALPIFSFRVRDGQGGHVHHQLFTRMLSDVHGIQARGGCACAGPYAHALLGIDRHRSERLRAAIAAGREIEKPGWVRLNLSYLTSDEKAAKIITAVADLADRAAAYTSFYRFDPLTARFSHEEAA